MAVLLLIETATPVCSIAVTKDRQLLALKESHEINTHSSQITVFIQEALREAQISMEQLDAVAISKGPGSYTGLRIGTSTAKGLCYALDKPLIAISTLHAMASGAIDHLNYSKDKCDKPVLLCPMIDARRMEVYTALFDSGLNEIKKTSALIINEGSFKSELDKNCMFFFGNGADKCREIFKDRENTIFLQNYQVSSKYMMSLAEEAFLNKDFEDLAYYEPYYLKDFIAGKPRVKGLE